MIILKLGHPISYNEVIDKSVFNSLDLAGFSQELGAAVGGRRNEGGLAVSEAANPGPAITA